MKNKLSKKSISLKLGGAFFNNYGEYQKSAVFYHNPADNIWKFNIPELKKQVLVECNEYSGDIKIEESEMVL